jgi:hypothetical protein
VFSCSESEQKQLNTWVSFQSAEQPLMGQFSVSDNTVAFYARDIFREKGPKGGTTQGLVAKFRDGSEQEFSVNKAVRAVAASS